MQQQIDQDHIQNPVKEQSKPEIIPEYTRLLVEPLLSSGLLKKRGYEILSRVIKQVTMNTNLNNLFYLILDEDKAGLNRREQLVFALSIIHIKKSKATAWLYKISINNAATLSEILERPKSKSNSPGATRKKFF